MKRISTIRIILLTASIFVLLQNSSLIAEEDRIDESNDFINVVKLSDRLIVVRTGVSYFDAVTAVATSNGIVVFDAGYSPTISLQYKEIIRKEFNRDDFKLLINTHGHWDHTNGNKAFSEALIIGHEKCNDEIISTFSDKEQFFGWLNSFRERCINSLQSNEIDPEEEKQLQCRANIYLSTIADFEQDYSYILPSMTFNDRLSLNMGDVTFDLFYFGKAHSDSDILVYVPEEKLLMAGDLFNRGGSGNLSMLNHNEVVKADVDRWYETLNFILQPDNEIEQVIDGHGMILTREDLLKFNDIVMELWGDFNSGRELSAGARLKQVFMESGLKAMVAEYQEMGNPENDKYYYYEAEFNDLAWHMVGDGELKAAIEVLKVIIKEKPGSWNAYDSLGELFMLDSNNELAIQNYMKSLEINPENDNAKQMLRNLQAI